MSGYAFHPDAFADLDEIWEYIAEDNLDAADRVLSDIHAVLRILAFAERVLPLASDLWVQASLDQRQRLQRLFFPGGVVFDGKRFVRTGVSTPEFKYLTSVEPAENNLASPARQGRVYFERPFAA